MNKNANPVLTYTWTELQFGDPPKRGNCGRLMGKRHWENQQRHHQTRSSEHCDRIEKAKTFAMWGDMVSRLVVERVREEVHDAEDLDVQADDGPTKQRQQHNAKKAAGAETTRAEIQHRCSPQRPTWTRSATKMKHETIGWDCSSRNEWEEFEGKSEQNFSVISHSKCH